MLYSLVIYSVSARFGQQNPPAEGKVSAAVGGGLGGQVPSTLLGGADPCAKLQLADKIVAAKPGDQAALDAAKALVNTEANFNPFVAGAAPKFCADAALPATKELRGILAQVSDQDLKTPFGANGGLTAAQINAIATKSLQTPLAADGKSVAQLYKEQGFNDFVGADKIQGGAAAPPQAPPAQAPPAQQGNQGGNKKVVTVTETVNSCPTEAPQAPPQAPPAQDNKQKDNKQQGGAGQASNCNADALQVIVQGKEHRFGFQGRQVALNPAIPIQNICQKVSANCAQACKQAGDAAVATGVKGFSGDDNAAQLKAMGELADKFNAALGIKTDFANAPGTQAGGVAPPAQGNNQNNKQQGQGAAQGGSNVFNGRNLNLCNKAPTMNFGTGFAGSANANEFRFKPLNEDVYKGQSTALNGAIIANFLCDSLNNICKAGAAEFQFCKTTATAAFTAKFDNNLKGTAAGGAAADAWNAVWGVTTNFASGGKA